MKSQSLPTLTILGIVATALLALGASEPSGPANPSRELKELKSLVTRLEKKVGDLEQRLKTLEGNPNWTVQPFNRSWPNHRPTYQSQRGTLQPIVPKPTVPEVWGQGEVNGWPYYVIPVEAGPGSLEPGGHSNR